MVTGASKGIGAGYREGAGGGGRRGGGELRVQQGGRRAVVADIKAEGGRAIAVQGDVARPADVQRLFDDRAGSLSVALDVLVNNAGVYQFAPLEEVTEGEFHREFDINVLGTILATREARRSTSGRRRQRHQHRSVASERAADRRSIPRPRAPSTRSRACSPPSLAPRNIRVNAIAPGGVETEGAHAAGIIGSDLEEQMVAARRSAASASRTTSRGSRCSSRPTTRRG